MGLDGVTLIRQGPVLADFDVEFWGHVNGVGPSASPFFADHPAQGEYGGLLELGIGLGLPSYARTGFMPYLELNALSFLVGTFDGSDFLSYQPNVALGFVGRHYGLSLAGGYALFGADAGLSRLDFADPASCSSGGFCLQSNGTAPFARADGYLDFLLSSRSALRLSARVQDWHQGLDVAGAPDFGSRDMFMGRVELLFRHDHATFGPAVTFFSPGKVPEDTGLATGYVGAPPETSVLLLFGI
ncbi:MAG: hypothetical protein ACYDCL_03745 [Myxococcales bacterium]